MWWRASVFIALVGVASVGPAAQPDSGVPGHDGLVVCTSAPACDAGASVLARGGNAVDAAVATAFALAVTHPSAGNIGGGGFMIVRTPDGRATAFDYRERAPLKATRTMYLGPDGQIVRSLTDTGYLAPGVPGTVRGLELAHKRFGKLPWKAVVMPAVRLAEEGFAVSAGLARDLNAQVAGPMAAFPASVAAYGKPGGGQWAEGDRLVLADLGRTLRAIAGKGAKAFYKGWIADRIADDMKANGGLITKRDLAAYEAKVRTPLKGTYRGYEIVSMPPPSSGGVALLSMLGMLERHDVAALGHGSSDLIHLQAEAMRRAFADRAEYLGDPDFVDVPVAKLLSPDYIRARAATIDPKRASTSAEIGPGLPARAEPTDTTHFTVVDKDGNVVANTYTLNDAYGSGVVAKGTGVLLNDEMDDFAAKPGTPNLFGLVQGERNAIAPRKRPLSSMTPTIVLDKGAPWLVTGAAGGPTIITAVLQTIVNVVDFGMNVQQAVDAPRVHHQWLPDEILHERMGMPKDVQEALRARGHKVRERAATDSRGLIASQHAAMIERGTGMRLGASDGRGRQGAVGY